MACEQQILELISRYVDGETSSVETSRAVAHLDTCPECKEMVQEWQRGIEMLDWTYSRALPEDAAELERLYETIHAAEAPAVERHATAWPWRRRLVLPVRRAEARVRRHRCVPQQGPVRLGHREQGRPFPITRGRSRA